MPPHRHRIVITGTAHAEFADILAYTEEEWGVEQRDALRGKAAAHGLDIGRADADDVTGLPKPDVGGVITDDPALFLG